MPQPSEWPAISNWPLPKEGIRFLTPRYMLDIMAAHPLTKGLYPVAMGYYPDAKEHQMSRHRHSDYLLIYCTAGAGILDYEGRQYTVGSGDLILLPKDHAHAYRASRHQPWTIYWLHYNGELAEALFDHIRMPGPVVQIGVQPRVVRVFDGLAELRRSAYQLAEFIQGCHQLQALLSYVALLAHQNRPQSGKGLDWERLRAIMQEHIHGQLNLDELASSANLSKYHFTKKFKSWSGQSPIQYFINMKVQRACYLLDSTGMSIKQVAAALGYDDAYYFSRLFKKVIGLSPKDYRLHRRG